MIPVNRDCQIRQHAAGTKPVAVVERSMQQNSTRRLQTLGQHRHLFRWIACSTLMTAILLTNSAMAFAEFQICNRSEYPELNAAYGYKDKDKGWSSRGWWKIPQGSCATVAKGPLNKGYYFTYVFGTRRIDETTTRSTTWEALAETKGSLFCINNKAAFALQLDEFIKAASSDLDCEGRGYQTKNFKEHVVETQGYIYNLSK